MLFVGLLRLDRERDEEFWAALWQGAPPPADFRFVAAYNLMTDLRVIVFEADSIETIRFFDRFNFVGEMVCHPALDQSEGYAAAFTRDIAGFEQFLRERHMPEPVVTALSANRRAAMEAPTLKKALRDAQGR